MALKGGTTTNKNKNLQLKCKISPVLWSRDLENNKFHNQLKANLHIINGCMRRILKIHWPDKIINEDLWTRTKQTPARNEIRRGRWRWIGNTLRKPMSNTTRQALSLSPRERERGVGLETPGRGSSRHTSKRWDAQTWSQIEKKASDRVLWRSFVDGLYPPRGVKA